MVEVFMELSEIPMCCGAFTAGAFQVMGEDVNEDDAGDWADSSGYDGIEVYGLGSSVEEAWADALRKAQKKTEGYSLQFWFVKWRDFEGKYGSVFEDDALRQLVLSKGASVITPEYVNPNTQNRVEGLVLFNGAS